MANEYMVNASDILGIANAIREKGGTTEGLAFPGDFITSIESIPTGGGLNLTVIGGTARPENPSENTIWVNTITPLNKWTLSQERPAAAVHGDVWVQITNTDESIDVLDENSLVIGIGGIEQYITDTWVMTSGEIFTNNVWTELMIDYPIFVLDGGSKAEFDSWADDNTVITNNGDVLNIYYTDQYANNSDFLIYTTSKIRTTEFNTLELALEVTGTTYFNYQTFGFAETVNNNQSSQTCVTWKSTNGSASTGTTYEFSLDISDLNGEYYFVFYGYYLHAKIKHIYLKKEAVS